LLRKRQKQPDQLSIRLDDVLGARRPTEGRAAQPQSMVFDPEVKTKDWLLVADGFRNFAACPSPVIRAVLQQIRCDRLVEPDQIRRGLSANW